MTSVRAILAVCAGLLVPAGAAIAQETPLDFLQQLIEPPARAVTDAFRSRPQAKTPKKAETVDLLSVPMPRLRPGDATGPALGYAPAAPTIEARPLAPEPQPRPAPPPMLSSAAAPATTIPAGPPSPPLPHPRPAGQSVAAIEAPAMSVPPQAPPVVLPPPAARSTCGAMIAQLGVEATPLAPVTEGACGIPAPVAVAGLDGGAIDFTDKAIIGCDLAETLARWSHDTVQPLAMKTLGKPVTGYRIAASYACRNRDGLADAKLSEHARGNAIDISGFKVDGEWIEVGPGWNGGGAKAEFLKALRTSACGPFTTVLGPGSDSFHTDHFHLDIIKRRTAGPSKGLYCH